MARLDGVVITGGHDVEPVLYKAAAEVKGHYDSVRDAFESAIIDYALANDLPLLGICRGAQLLNVRLGGSLFQDLRSRRHKTSNRRTILPLKTVYVLEGTQLREIASADRLKVNSLHKQSVDVLGAGLRIAGRDQDDIVQAIEHPKRRFLIGVQWHPEFLIYLPSQRRVFEALVHAACDVAPTAHTQTAGDLRSS